MEMSPQSQFGCSRRMQTGDVHPRGVSRRVMLRFPLHAADRRGDGGIGWIYLWDYGSPSKTGHRPRTGTSSATLSTRTIVNIWAKPASLGWVFSSATSAARSWPGSSAQLMPAGFLSRISGCMPISDVAASAAICWLWPSAGRWGSGATLRCSTLFRSRARSFIRASDIRSTRGWTIRPITSEFS